MRLLGLFPHLVASSIHENMAEKKMEYVKCAKILDMCYMAELTHSSLGKSGLKVSKVILGAMSYGSSKWQPWVLDEAESLPLLEHAYKCGINTWDTVRSASLFSKRTEAYGTKFRPTYTPTASPSELLARRSSNSISPAARSSSSRSATLASTKTTSGSRSTDRTRTKARM